MTLIKESEKKYYWLGTVVVECDKFKPQTHSVCASTNIIDLSGIIEYIKQQYTTETQTATVTSICPISEEMFNEIEKAENVSKNE